MTVYTDEREAIAIYGLQARGRVPIRSDIFHERDRNISDVRCQHDRSIFDPCPECEASDPRAGDASRLTAEIDAELLFSRKRDE